MGCWPLPLLRGGPDGPARGRSAVKAGADGVLDVLYPVLLLGRGLGRLAVAGRRWWQDTPPDKRGAPLFLGVVGVLVVAMLPYGPALAVIALVATAVWYGRDHEGSADDGPPGPGEDELARLQAVYEALVPCFALPEEFGADPLYSPGGEWERALEEFAFTEEGRIGALRLRYPASFRDGDPQERLRVEQLLVAKSGRAREYRFVWDEERNRLAMTVLGPLPVGIQAQRFVTGPGEVLLGFTDAETVQRTVPVRDGEQVVDLPPVMWRTGARSTESHLLAMGLPGSGTSTLLRSVALQALERGDVLVVDGSGAGEFACLGGRSGVLGVESSLVGALAALEWAVHETERRLLAASRARQAGEPVPQDARRPLWLVVDRPAVLSHLAAAEGRRDPQELLQVPLRHGRAAHVTVAVAEQFEGAEGLGQAVRAYTRARVVLGAVSRDEARAVLGEAPCSAVPDAPPGRGFARLGAGPVLRLQTPSTPDPYDEAAGEHERHAVRGLLPQRTASPAAPPAPDGQGEQHGQDGQEESGGTEGRPDGPDEAAAPGASPGPTARVALPGSGQQPEPQAT